jgi:hypothetical protein
MTRRHLHAGLVAGLAATAVALPAAPASALLGLNLDGVGQIVGDLGGTVGGTLPVGGGIVTDVTGTVGGVVTGISGTLDGTVGGVVDGVLGGDTGTGGLLSNDALSQLLGTLGLAPAAGTTGPGGTTAGGLVVDARAPNARFKVLSRLARVSKTGKLRMRATTDEAGIVAFSGSMRPGKSRHTKHKAQSSAGRKAIKIPTAVLAFRSPGSLVVTIQLSRQAQRALGRARNARLSLGIVTADLLRNQAKSRVTKTVKR